MIKNFHALKEHYELDETDGLKKFQKLLWCRLRKSERYKCSMSESREQFVQQAQSYHDRILTEGIQVLNLKPSALIEHFLELNTIHMFGICQPELVRNMLVLRP